MKKLMILICSLITVVLACAQVPKDAAIAELVEAEKAFAQMAKEQNTTDAFLFYFADDVVSASPGNGPIIGKHHLEKQNANESLLSWYPVFSDIAASGDFGYNTGPWAFHVKETDAQPVAYGQFASMWKKNERGEWKVVIDVGISHGKPEKALPLKSSFENQNRKAISAGANKTAPFDREKNFIEQFRRAGKAAYQTTASKEIKFFRPGNEPFTAAGDVAQFLAHTNENISFAFMDGDIASSGDLAYVYGRASIDVVHNGVSKITQHTYMRFWKLEDGEWKIVLDLISD